LGLIKKVVEKKLLEGHLKFFFPTQRGQAQTEGGGMATRREELAKRHPRESASLRKKNDNKRPGKGVHVGVPGIREEGEGSVRGLSTQSME